MYKCVVNNVVYVSKPGGCVGCAGRKNDELCEALPGCGSVHWVREDSRVALTKTLRDEFAMAALQGMAAIPGSRDYKYEAMAAYKYADAMLKAREVK